MQRGKHGTLGQLDPFFRSPLGAAKRPRGQARRAWPRRAKRVGGWVSENDSIVRVCSPITIPEIPFCLLCSPKLWHINKKISKNSWKRNMAFVYFFCLHGAKVLVSLAERQKRNKQKTNTLAPWRHAIAKISVSLKNSQNWLFLGSNRGFGSTKIFIILVTYLVIVFYVKWIFEGYKGKTRGCHVCHLSLEWAKRMKDI